jgi:hypothetical protein
VRCEPCCVSRCSAAMICAVPRPALIWHSAAAATAARYRARSSGTPHHAHRSRSGRRRSIQRSASPFLFMLLLILRQILRRRCLRRISAIRARPPRHARARRRAWPRQPRTPRPCRGLRRPEATCGTSPHPRGQRHSGRRAEHLACCTPSARRQAQQVARAPQAFKPKEAAGRQAAAAAGRCCGSGEANTELQRCSADAGGR